MWNLEFETGKTPSEIQNDGRDTFARSVMPHLARICRASRAGDNDDTHGHFVRACPLLRQLNTLRQKQTTSIVN